MARKPLTSVEDARDIIISSVPITALEEIDIRAARGRVLGSDLKAKLTHPPFKASAMDGYAVRMADIPTIPTTLTVAGEMAAGTDPTHLTCEPRQAIRIFTGAPLPGGADTIVIQENTVRHGDKVEIVEMPVPGRHIRPAGLDFSQDDVIAPKGERLYPARIGLMASADHATVLVHRKPRVGILTSGDELVLPGHPRKPGQIISSNTIALSALVEALGAVPVDLGIARDRVEDIQHAVANRSELDLIVTIGGASVGDHDLVHKALTEIGLDVDFWRIAMRPGKPMMWGQLRGTPFLGLPGNPASSLVCAHVFLVPLLRKMLGQTPVIPAIHKARLGTSVTENDIRQDYLRSKLTTDEGGGVIITPFQKQDSAMIRPFAEADALLIRPPFGQALETGAIVEYLPLRVAVDHLFG